MLVVTSCPILILLLVGLTGAVPQTEEGRFFQTCHGGSDGTVRFFQTCTAERNETWSYKGLNGPASWGNGCRGERQSPIALCKETAKKNDSLTKLELNGYDIDVNSATIENNGHTVQVTPGENEPPRSMQIGSKTCILKQCHFHWGSSVFGIIHLKGSEHTMDGKRYAMELHFVHICPDDGEIAVLGVFFQEGGSNNTGLQKIIERFSQIRYKDSSTDMIPPLSLKGLLPNTLDPYYRYEGSLTTPGCNEGVTWTVLTNVVNVSTEQMNRFRTELYSVKEEDASDGYCVLRDNYRPLQDLNGRTVYLSQ